MQKSSFCSSFYAAPSAVAGFRKAKKMNSTALPDPCFA
ncbi:MAG: hypothetical protein GQF41_1642 [Candidatus Rifleibacterium amylolyticum]|nr:MAG: hypothetical protein GQF41_1642 [Candidatus Rifleibacterium amylolyticum]